MFITEPFSAKEEERARIERNEDAISWAFFPGVQRAAVERMKQKFRDRYGESHDLHH